MTDCTEAPGEAYRTRLQILGTKEAECQRHHVVLGYLRLLLVVAGLVLAWYAFHHALSGWWLLAPCAAFVAVARIHSATLARRSRVQRSVRFYQLGLTRMEERWEELPARETRVDVHGSLFARDLDLFGDAYGTLGLFNLLCTARTSIGEDALASWLLEPPPRAETLARQEAVKDLRTRLAVPEDLAGCEGPETAVLDAKALAEWGSAVAQVLPGWLRWLAPVLVVLTLAVLGYAFVGSPVPIVVALIVDATLTYALLKRLEPLFAATERASRSLHLASALLARLESERFEAPLLQALQKTWMDSDGGASKALARLAALAGRIDARRNFIVRVLDAPLLYSVQLASAVQAWRRKHGRSLEPWLRSLGEFEALASLATYSYEHPNDPFPDLVEGAPCFQALALGHPLLPAAKCVRNDVALGGETQLLLVSGSNMSGKSTLLRSVGVNAVLAMAGAPVRASSLRLTRLHVGASIQVNDSLQEGRSRFYAEILRLRAVCALAVEQPPVLFLLDELLGGTNSSDRLAGAEGVARALVAAGAIGLISTHDLALTEIGAEGDRSLHNVHFEDRIEGGEMRFDFKLREGAVTTRNGLALMRMIGLQV